MTKRDKKYIINTEKSAYAHTNERKGNFMRNEKGSVTLFVLVTMLLIVTVLIIVYMRISERNNNQMQQIEKIQEEYQSENIDQVYQETLQKEGLNQ